MTAGGAGPVDLVALATEVLERTVEVASVPAPTGGEHQRDGDGRRVVAPRRLRPGVDRSGRQLLGAGPRRERAGDRARRPPGHGVRSRDRALGEPLRRPARRPGRRRRRRGPRRARGRRPPPRVVGGVEAGLPRRHRGRGGSREPRRRPPRRRPPAGRARRLRRDRGQLPRQDRDDGRRVAPVAGRGHRAGRPCLGAGRRPARCTRPPGSCTPCRRSRRWPAPPP